MLPGTVRVKLSSEAAESIALTPVVVRDMPTPELLDHIVAVAGKDAARVRELLARGSLVHGASRFRWQGWDATAEDVAVAMAAFPDPDPSRPFDGALCRRALLLGPARPIEIAREAAEQKPLFTRESFWGALLACCPAPAYRTYSYRDRADVYVAAFSSAESARLREATARLRFAGLKQTLRLAPLTGAELFVERGSRLMHH